jgi:hypothetical protein
MALIFRRLFYLLSVFSLAALACSSPGAAVPTATPGTFGQSVETAVAGTVQALTQTLPAPISSTPTSLAKATKTPVAPVETLPPVLDSLPTALPPEILRVAYIDTSRNLWLWVEGGGNVQLTHSGDVVGLHLSPDGEQVVFVRAGIDQRDASLWAIARNGSLERQLLSQADLRALAPVRDAVGIYPAQISWVPGRNQVAVGTRAVFEGPGLLYNHDLILIDLSSGSHTVVFPMGEGGMFFYSPDGAQIALVKQSQIDLVNADGGNRRSAVLTYPAVRTYSEYEYYPTPVWSADAASISVAVPPPAPLDDLTAVTTLWRISTAGGVAEQTGSILTAPLRWPLLSPDGQRVVFLAPAEGSPGPLNLSLAGAVGGSGIELYTNNGGTVDQWTPDSARFVYHEHNAAAAMLGTSGAPAVPLTDSLDVRSVLFAADGRAVFLSMVETTWEVRYCLPTAPSRLIASFPASDNYPLIDTLR